MPTGWAKSHVSPILPLLLVCVHPAEARVFYSRSKHILDPGNLKKDSGEDEMVAGSEPLHSNKVSWQVRDDMCDVQGATASLATPKSPIGISLVIHLNLKYTRKRILRNSL